MSKVKIDCHKVIDLYDTRQTKDGGFATAVSSIGGEEMGLALLQHYLESQNKNVQRIAGVPKTGNKIGNRLDGWFVVDGELMQIEVKNWGANALGGIPHNGDWAGVGINFYVGSRLLTCKKFCFPCVRQLSTPAKCNTPPLVCGRSCTRKVISLPISRFL